MTREEAIALLNEQYETCKRIYDCSADQRKSYPNVPQFMEALGMALSALRPVSREQVEKVWRGEWIIQKDEHSEFIKKCSKCGFPISRWWGADKFCANCGAPMTDEAALMVMERLEALKDGKKKADKQENRYDAHMQ